MKLPHALLCLAPLALASCVSHSDKISGSDTSSFLPSGRIAVPLDKESVQLEVDVAFGEGSFDQNLGAGESVRLESVTFLGPGVVDVDFELRRIWGAARLHHEGSDGFGLSVIGGLSLNKLDATATMGGVKDSTSADVLGAVLGVEPYWRMNETTRLYGQLAIMPGIAGDYDSVDFTEIDVGVGFTPSPSFEIAVGWRRWEFEAEATGGLDSDLDLVLSGPHVSLRLTPRP